MFDGMLDRSCGREGADGGFAEPGARHNARANDGAHPKGTPSIAVVQPLD